jgi:hypothetical protein
VGEHLALLGAVVVAVAAPLSGVGFYACKVAMRGFRSELVVVCVCECVSSVVGWCEWRLWCRVK